MTGSVFRPEQFKRKDTDTVFIEDETASGANAHSAQTIQAKLYAKISELKAQNNELRKLEESDWEKDLEIDRLRVVESELRAQISSFRALANHETYRTTDQSDEILKLRVIIDRHESAIKIEKDEYMRKLSRISDQAWEKDIEIKRLTGLIDQAKAQLGQYAAHHRDNEGQLIRSHRDTENLQRALADTRNELQALRAANEIQAGAISERISASTAAAVAARESEITRLQFLEVKLTDESKALAAQNIELASELRHSSKSLVETQAKFERSKDELSTLKNSHAFELKQIFDDHVTAMVKIKEEFQAERNSVIEKHAQEIKAVTIEFTRQQQLEKAHAQLELKRVTDREDSVKAELAKAQSEVRRIETKIQELTSALNSAQSQVSFEQVQLAKVSDESKHRLQQIEDAKVEIELHKTGEAKLQSTLQLVLDEKRRLESQVDELLNRTSYMSRDLIELRDRVKQEEVKTRDFQRNVETAQSRLSAAESNVESTRALLARAELELEKSEASFKEESEKHDKTHAAAIAKISSAEERYRELEQLLKQAHEVKAREIAELNRINQELHMQVHGRQIEQSESEATNRVLQEQLKEKTQRFEETSSKLESLQADMQVCLIEISTSQTLLKAKADVVENLESTLQSARAESDERTQELEEKIDLMESELNSLRRHLSTRATGVEAETRDLEKRAHSVLTREQHLRQYANSISEHKAELARHTKLIADEMQMAIKAHPLKDYLAATEFQLSKVEIQLKTTPMVSPDRPHLEACLRQMVEQRDFLRTVVTASEKRLADYAANVMAILNSPKLASIPPLPPASFTTQSATPPSPPTPRQTSGL